jgi:hypothetical protein
MCKKNLQNINYAILCEEMKILQMFDYSGIKNQILNLKKQLKDLLKCKKKRDERGKVIEGITILIQMYEDEQKYIFETIKQSTQTFCFHRENVEAHIQALNGIIRPAV